jgi:hypothetical protein
MWHVWGRREEHAGAWWDILRERDTLEDLDVDGNIILKWILRHCVGA